MRRVLQHNHCKFSVWRDHDFVDGRTNFDKGDVLLWVQRLNGVGSLIHELRDETSIVDGVVLLHRTLDCDTLFVHNDDAEDTHMRVDAV